MIGQMNLKRRQERSYNGLPVRDLKSGLQKYVRRGNLEKGLWCLVELDLFRQLEAEPESIADYLQAMNGEKPFAAKSIVQKAKALRTNFINRLVVMVTEEVSISTYWLPLAIEPLRQAWIAARDVEESRQYPITIYKYLAQSSKIRLVSDLKSVYLLPPDYVQPRQLVDLRQIHRDLILSLDFMHLLEGSHEIPEKLIDCCCVDLNPFVCETDEELRQIVNGLLYHLKIESDHAFYWIGRLIDWQREESGAPKFGGRTDLMNVVWRLLFGFARKREGLWGEPAQSYPENFQRLGDILAVLKTWYDEMTHRERPVYLFHAVLLVVRRNQIDWTSEMPSFETSREEVEQLYQANLSGKVIQLDPFVLDLHTGRRKGASLTEFALKGAFVENENTLLRNNEYRQVYVGLKERLDVYEQKGLPGVSKRFGEAQCC